MKGLLIKDFKLLLGQKRFFAIVIGFGLFFMFLNENPSAGIGYVTMLLTIFTLSTMSYDEFDNGMAYLMTLPVTRKTYVREKYVFAGVIALLAAIGSTIMALISSYIMNISFVMLEAVVTGGTLILVAWLILAVTIPVQMKFGAEKSRVAMMMAMGAIFIVFMLLMKGIEYFGGDLTGVVSFFVGLDAGLLIFMGVFAAILVLLASCGTSVRIILKKEY